MATIMCQECGTIIQLGEWYEDVEGKYIIVEYEDGAHSHLTFIETEKTYRDLIVNNPILSNFKKYSVVDFSDEPVYCEWEKLPDNGNGHYESTCNHDFYGGTGNTEVLNFSFCPHCSLPIKVIDELKPLPLMGIEPKLERHLVNDSLTSHRFYIHTKDVYIYPRWEDTEREAIESWNSLVKKLTGQN